MQNPNEGYIELWTVLVTTIVTLLAYSGIYLYFRKKSFGRNNTFQVYLTRISGVILLGILPVWVIRQKLLMPLTDFGASLVKPISTFAWTTGLSIIIILLTLKQAKKENNLKAYPQIRKQKWSILTLIFSAITWILYLLAYEFLFRGFLFSGTLHSLGAVWAITINVILYAVAHLPKGKFETIGAIPLGLVLCLLTLQSQSIWIAFFVHVVMALSNEWISLYHHPDIHLVQSKSLKQNLQ